MELDQELFEFWGVLFEIVADLEKRLAAHMAAHQLTPPQFYVLKTLMEHGGRCRIGRIAEEHHLTNATMTGLIKRLEAMNPPLVSRETSAEDARSVNVLITSEGEERYWAVYSSLMQQTQAFLALFPREERLEALQKLRVYFRVLVEHFPLPTDPQPQP